MIWLRLYYDSLCEELGHQTHDRKTMIPFGKQAVNEDGNKH